MYTWYLGRMFSFCLICYYCMSLSKSCPSVHFLKLDKTSVLRCWVLIFRSEAALVNNVLLSQTQSPKKLFFVCLILLNSKDRAEVKELSMYNNKKLYGKLVNVWRVSSLSLTWSVSHRCDLFDIFWHLSWENTKLIYWFF